MPKNRKFTELDGTDWICEKCGSSNSVRREECYSCGWEAPSYMTEKEN